MEHGQTPGGEPPEEAHPPPGQWPTWQQPPGPAPYWGQTPYYGAPPVAPWPAPVTTAQLVKAPPAEHPKELPWRLAGWWSRVGAQLLDLLIVWVPGGLVAAAPLIAAAESRDGSSAETVWLIVGIVVSFIVVGAHLFYAPLLMRRKGRRNGQTFGKQISSIRVIRADGDPMRFSDAAMRQIVFKSFGGVVASTFIPLFPWVLNYLWPTWDEQHRALHDMAAKTRVVAA
jgi:uncharacterized RDD family membrane protein YckC